MNESARSALDTEAGIRARRHKKSSWAYGRRNSITRLLIHRHGEQCETDDAPAWLEAVLPFIVEATIVANRSTLEGARVWARRRVPAYLDEIGEDGLHEMVDRLVVQRARAAAAQGDLWRDFVTWCPSMAELSERLRPTRAELAATVSTPIEV